MRIGIDVGGMSVKIGLCDGEKILCKKSLPTGKHTDFFDLVNAICTEINGMTKNVEYDFVGISSCGLIDSKSGSVVYSNNILWENKPLAKEISNVLKKPTFIANDAKCAGLAEAILGAGKNYDRVCTLTIGTGVGGAFICNKRLESGNIFADASQILGHITVQKNGRPCSCGRKGCLEAYASATALMQIYEERTGIRLTAKEIFEKARNGGKTELELVAEFSDYLAEGIADIVNVLRPQIVVIGGGCCGAADLFLDSMQQEVNQRIFAGNHLPVKLTVAKFKNDAGIIGATLLKDFT